MSIDMEAKELVLQVVKERQEPDWLRDLRLQALDYGTQATSWSGETSDLNKRMMGHFPPLEPEPPTPVLFDLDKMFGRRDAKNRLIFTNEKVAEHRLQASIAKKGVMFTSLSMAVRLFSKLVQPYLGQVIPVTTNKWVAMQSALWNNGMFLYVPRKVKVLLPLHVWWHRTLGGGRLHPRILVVAEESSEVTLVTGETSQLEEDAFSVLIAEVVAKKGAHVRIISLQEQSERMTRLCFARAQVGTGARVEWLYGDGGTGHSVVELGAELRGEGARAKLKGLALGHQWQHLDLTLQSHHIAPQTHSEITGRGIMSQSARTRINVAAQIDRGAVHAESYQSERLMLLDDSAQANEVPVCNFSQDDLFYLMARGLSEKQAKTVLLRGFLAPLVKDLSINGVKKLLDGWLERKIRI